LGEIQPLLKILKSDWISKIIRYHNNISPARFSDFNIKEFLGFGVDFFGNDFSNLVQIFEQVFKVLFDVPVAGRKLKIRNLLFPGLSKLVFLFLVNLRNFISPFPARD
jgi:hypothetical protein